MTDIHIRLTNAPEHGNRGEEGILLHVKGSVFFCKAWNMSCLKELLCLLAISDALLDKDGM